MSLYLTNYLSEHSNFSMPLALSLTIEAAKTEARVTCGTPSFATYTDNHVDVMVDGKLAGIIKPMSIKDFEFYAVTVDGYEAQIIGEPWEWRTGKDQWYVPCRVYRPSTHESSYTDSFPLSRISVHRLAPAPLITPEVTKPFSIADHCNLPDIMRKALDLSRAMEAFRGELYTLTMDSEIASAMCNGLITDDTENYLYTKLVNAHDALKGDFQLATLCHLLLDRGIQFPETIEEREAREYRESLSINDDEPLASSLPSPWPEEYAKYVFDGFENVTLTEAKTDRYQDKPTIAQIQAMNFPGNGSVKRTMASPDFTLFPSTLRYESGFDGGWTVDIQYCDVADRNTCVLLLDKDGTFYIYD